MFPVRQARIPLNIRDTNNPEDQGTIIDEEFDEKELGRQQVLYDRHCRTAGVLYNRHKAGKLRSEARNTQGCSEDI